MIKLNKIYLICSLICFIALLTVNEAIGQFYNGHQMTFGKNRVQFDRSEMQKSDFFWSFYRFNSFDVYYHVNGKELAEFTGKFAFSEMNKIERFFDYTLDRRIIFIVYNKLSDFRQSNIGLVSSHSLNNVGGVTRIIDNKVFLYFDGNHKKFEQQIISAMTEVLLGEMLYGGNIRQRVSSSTFMNLPEWYIKGLVSYVSNNWDFEIENRVKDGILTGRFEKFNRLSGDDALYAGHSIWNFLARNYGKSIIPNIIYFTKINKNVNSGFTNVLGRSFKEISWEWLEYYKSIFTKETYGELPDTGQILKKRKEKEKVYLQPRISPDGNKIAYATNELGQYKIVIYDSEKNKHKVIKKTGHKLDQIPDYTYPILEWHPGGEILSIITEEKGRIILSYYNISTEKEESKEMFYFEKILDFSYSGDGLKLVMSAVKNGQSDIFVHNLASNTDERITNDVADDSYPRFINNSEQILFNSNRKENDLESDNSNEKSILPGSALYIYDYKTKSKQLFTLSETQYINKINPFEESKDKYFFLSDQNGIYNRYFTEFDSTISLIDTIIHYRFFTREKPLTNYSRNILEHHYNKQNNKFTELVYSNGRYNIFTGTMDNSSFENSDVPVSTTFRKSLTRKYFEEDSLRLLAENIGIEEKKNDSLLQTKRNNTPEIKNQQQIDINRYIFDVEKTGNNRSTPSSITLYRNDPASLDEFEIPPVRIYRTAFYTNFLVNQIDYGFLNNSYQPYTGGGAFYNPGMNGLFKVGTHDLFEDYRITAGFKFSGNLDSNEFLISVENLKNRLDKELIFHRQSYKNLALYSYNKILSNELLFSLKYPFSQVAAVRATLSGRVDRSVYLATDIYNLDSLDVYRNWLSLKFEYIFDNTRNLGINLYQGSRFKVFGEWYKSVNRQNTNVFVLGADFRHYIKIHRTLIWANRAAVSNSFGSGRLIYYLGGVDNWSNFSVSVPTFDYSVPVDPTQNFVFQSLATNMRGFSQNIRNGNSFAIINSEMRWPIFTYFANRPLSSDFLNSLQLVGFADVGAAWNGISPYNSVNAYNYEIIKNGPITVTIDKEKGPFVAGVGFGLRARLFGYFIRTDWAWGIENGVVLPRVFYLSLTLDF
ncbi:hypothetical protein ACFLTI_06875 [Bacteroidota bacterium]